MHATYNLLMLRPIFTLFYDEGNDRCEFECKGDREDEAGEETSNCVVDLLLLICSGHGMINGCDRNRLRVNSIEDGLGS